MTAQTRHEIVRQRLIDEFALRWRHRVTLVEAAAGAGKTMALHQAIVDNQQDPTGTDYYLSCPKTPGRLALALESTLLDANRAHGSSTAVGLLDLLAGIAGGLVCIVVDDVHRLAHHNDLEVLEALMVDAPQTVHFVLAGRSIPDGPWARLALDEELHQVGEGALRFDETELVRFAETNAVDASRLTAFAGWPALCRIGLRGAPEVALDYLLREVIADADEPARRGLALAAMSHEATGELLDRVSSSTEALASFPLVDLDANGQPRVHDLWAEHLTIVVSESQRTEIAEIASQWKLDTGDPVQAARIAIEHGLRDQAQRAIRALSFLNDRFIPSQEAVALAKQFRESELSTRRYQALLDGLVCRMAEDGADATTQYTRAMAEMRRSKDLDGEGAALLQLAGRRWRNGDPVDELVPLIARIGELVALGVDELAPLLMLAEAAFHDLAGDSARAYELMRGLPLDELPRDWATAVASWTVTLAGLAGRSRSTVPVGAALAERFPSGPMELNLVRLAFEAGDPLPVIEALSRVNPSDALTVSAWDRLEVRSFQAVAAAALGDSVDVHIDMTALVGDRAAGYQAIGEVAAMVARGDEDRATERLASFLSQIGSDSALGIGELLRWPAYAYVLSEPLRATLDERALGPDHRRQVEIARLLSDLRNGVPIAVSALDADELICALPLMWNLELAIRLESSDAKLAASLLRHLVDRVGPTLPATAKRLLVSKPELTEGWTALQQQIPTPPPRPIVIRTGPSIEIIADTGTVPLTGKRALLLSLLVLHRTCTRTFLADALWPTMPERNARTNLRVTLSGLRSILDAHCGPNIPGYNLRTSEETISLNSSLHLSVDLWEAQDAVVAALRSEDQADYATARALYGTGLANWPHHALALLRDTDSVAAIENADASLARASLRWAELSLGADKHDDVRAICEDLLLRDRLHDEAYRLLLRSALATKTHPDARYARDGYLNHLDQYGAAPTPENRRLLSEVRTLMDSKSWR